MKIIIITITIIIIIIQPIKAYYIGYTQYGIKNNETEKIIKETINKELKEEEQKSLGSIIISNSKCVNRYGGNCNIASFQYKGKWTRITIGRIKEINKCEIKMYITHEIIHLKQYNKGTIKQNQNGFDIEIEEEAEQESYKKVYEEDKECQVPMQ